jgi:outer membrane protein assembly factor BamB
MGVNAIACARGGASDLEPEVLAPTWEVASQAPSADAEVPEAASEIWRATLGRRASGPPIVGPTVVAAASLDRYVMLINRENGDRLWRHKMSAPGAAAPLVAGNRVFAASAGPEGSLYAFTLEGRKLWEVELPFIEGPLAVVDSAVIAGTERGGVIALSTATGEVRWLHRLSEPSRAGVVHLSDTSVLVATDDSLFRMNGGDGSVEARRDLGGTVIAPAARQGDTVVVATAGGRLVALRERDLEVLWHVDLNAPVFGGVALARDTAFAVSIQGDLWRVPLRQPDRASAVSVRGAVRARPSPVRSGVLVGTLTGEILLVRGNQVLPQGRVEGPIEQPVLAADGVLYIVDGRGQLQAWR